MYRLVPRDKNGSIMSDAVTCRDMDEVESIRKYLGTEEWRYHTQRLCVTCNDWFDTGLSFGSHVCGAIPEYIEPYYPEEKVMRNKSSRRNSSTVTVYIPDGSYDYVRGMAMAMGFWVKSGYSKKANMCTLQVKGPKDKVAYVRGYVDGINHRN